MNRCARRSVASRQDLEGSSVSRGLLRYGWCGPGVWCAAGVDVMAVVGRRLLAGQGGEGGGGEVAGADGFEQVVDCAGQEPFCGGAREPADGELAEAHVVLEVAVGVSAMWPRCR